MKSHAAKPLALLLEFLRRRWLAIALVFLAGAGLTALAVSKHNAYYKATSKIVCKANQGSDSRLMALPELASLAPFLSGGGRDPSTYFEDLVKDPEFLYRILEDTFQTSTGALQYHELEEVPLPDSVLRNPLLKMMKYGSIASAERPSSFCGRKVRSSRSYPGAEIPTAPWRSTSACFPASTNISLPI